MAHQPPTNPSSMALTKKSLDTELMPPPPPIKRIKRPPVVLDEDTYTDALSEIIARDFFPGLLEAKHQQEYLDALDSNDAEWIRDASRKLSEVMTPQYRNKRRKVQRHQTGFTPLAAWGGVGVTPRFGDTPGTVMSTPGSVISTAASSTSTAQPSKPAVDTSLSLDAFQAKYTSEDNASFNDILDKQNEKRRNAYAWLWSGNNKIAGNRAKMAARLLKQRAEKEEAEGRGDEQKSIAWIDDRKAAPETWKSRPRNDFMFIPEGMDDAPPIQAVQPTTTTTTESDSQKAKTLAPKSIAYSNTRLASTDASPSGVQIPPPSPSYSAIQDAIAGYPRRSSASSTVEDGNATPRVNGYAFVDDEPTPSELSGFERQQQRGGDWDTSSIVGIPLPTSSSSSHASTTGPSPFKIPPQPKREALLNRMVDKVAKGKRATAGSAAAAAAAAALNSPAVQGTPRFASAKGLMTPAAQRLWSSVAASPRGVGGRSTTPGGGGFGGEVFGGKKVGGGAGGEAGLKAKMKFTPTPKRAAR
ncbi:nuclear protein DGCR14 [Peziza echinospora]|nr:nuclear protein DGCR14 [Peziza echinospora]